MAWITNYIQLLYMHVIIYSFPKVSAEVADICM